MQSNPYRSWGLLAVVSLFTAAAGAQSDVVMPGHSDTFAIRISMENQLIPTGQHPRLRLMVWNLSGLWIKWPADSCAGQSARIWIQGEHGEPPTTVRERIDTGRSLPGDQRLECTLNAGYPLLSPASTPADTQTVTYQLEFLYDLQAAGKYTVYVDVPSLSPEGWVRSNSVNFEVAAEQPHAAKSTP